MRVHEGYIQSLRHKLRPVNFLLPPIVLVDIILLCRGACYAVTEVERGIEVSIVFVLSPFVSNEAFLQLP